MMKTYKNLLFGLLAACSANFSIGQTQTSFSLNEAEEFGVNNNEQVKNALLDIESAKKKVWETTANNSANLNANTSAYTNITGNFTYMRAKIKDFNNGVVQFVKLSY